MSNEINPSQLVQDIKKPHIYEINDSNLKNVLNQIITSTNIQKQILKKMEENSNNSKLEKTLVGVKKDLRDIQSSQNDFFKFKKNFESIKQITTNLSDLQLQLKEIKEGISSINLPNLKNKNKEEKQKNKELKKEEKQKNKGNENNNKNRKR